MKVLVTGARGQLGTDLMKAGRMRNWEMIGTGIGDLVDVKLDITDEANVRAVLNEYRPQIVLHAAAYTNVDLAESQTDICRTINVTGTRYLASESARIGASFLYFSTDYVFNGAGSEPFTENDEKGPLGVYGQSKLDGELEVQKHATNWFIVRVSWLYGHHGHNFVKTMLRLGAEKSEINVVADQIGTPTYTVHLAEFVCDLVKTNKYGVYHATNDGFCSWAEFARAIFSEAQQNVIVNDVTSAEYVTAAVRPANSRLSKDKLIAADFKMLAPWQQALRDYMAVNGGSK